MKNTSAVEVSIQAVSPALMCMPTSYDPGRRCRGMLLITVTHGQLAHQESRGRRERSRAAQGHLYRAITGQTVSGQRRTSRSWAAACGPRTAPQR